MNIRKLGSREKFLHTSNTNFVCVLDCNESISEKKIIDAINKSLSLVSIFNSKIKDEHIVKSQNASVETMTCSTCEKKIINELLRMDLQTKDNWIKIIYSTLDSKVFIGVEHSLCDITSILKLINRFSENLNISNSICQEKISDDIESTCGLNAVSLPKIPGENKGHNKRRIHKEIMLGSRLRLHKTLKIINEQFLSCFNLNKFELDYTIDMRNFHPHIENNFGYYSELISIPINKNSINNFENDFNVKLKEASKKTAGISNLKPTSSNRLACSVSSIKRMSDIDKNLFKNIKFCGNSFFFDKETKICFIILSVYNGILNIDFSYDIRTTKEKEANNFMASLEQEILKCF